MVTYTVHEAKTQLSKLIAKVEAGEQVVITRNGEPVVEVKPFVARGPRKPGRYAGQFEVPESFF